MVTRNSHRALLTLTVPALLLAAACAPVTHPPGNSQPTTPTPTSSGSGPKTGTTPVGGTGGDLTAPPVGSGAVFTREEDASQRTDLRFEVVSVKPAYGPKETVVVQVKLTNVSDKPIAYTVWNLGDPVVYVWVETPFGNMPLYEPGQESLIVLPAVSGGELKPGETVEREVAWDQTVPLNPERAPAPAGEYTIVAQFNLGAYQGEEPITRVVTRTTVRLEGERTGLIAPEKAKETALALEQVQAWLAAHTGSAIVKEENGQWYALFHDDWQKVTPEFAQELRQVQPEALVQYLTGLWEVRLFTKLGADPHEVVVQVDAASGKVLKVETYNLGKGYEGKEPQPVPPEGTAPPRGTPAPPQGGNVQGDLYTGEVVWNDIEGRHLELDIGGKGYVIFADEALRQKLESLVGCKCTVTVRAKPFEGMSIYMRPGLEVVEIVGVATMGDPAPPSQGGGSSPSSGGQATK